MPTPSDWDRVDQAGLDSFPASDPPAWNGSHAAPSSSTTCPDDGVTSATSGPRLRAFKRTVTVFFALGALLGLAAIIRRRHA